jgi:hypothetical protein
MTEKQYRRQWLRWHSGYEKIVYRQLLSSFRASANSIPLDFLTIDNYKVLTNVAVKEEPIISMYYDFYKKVGIIHGKRLGKQFNRDIKEFTIASFLSIFEKELLGFLYGRSLSRITSVRQGLVLYLQEFIAQGVSDNKTIVEIRNDITKLVNRKDFYRWQALRIARTETTAAANYASTLVSKTSGVDTDKVWISAGDARTRRLPKDQFSHVAMNLVKVPSDQPFKVPSKSGVQDMMYPGDPNGSAGNVINCRCSSAIVPRRDKDGRLIRV